MFSHLHKGPNSLEKNTYCQNTYQSTDSPKPATDNSEDVRANNPQHQPPNSYKTYDGHSHTTSRSCYRHTITCHHLSPANRGAVADQRTTIGGGGLLIIGVVRNAGIRRIME